ncbi:putative metal-dependent hydrolase [Flavobacterium enshiense DK69]|uniref:Cyclase n=1 Tax=Flavobacterium enshiense DK69 TaxID=1107311 RepID=V6S0W8_9FLAO|nr:cyclase family protein [Flavobacterium enshiense]ESU20313.1 putative metal-dependent hydrolase [Flavobacterium enshiense DK69]KGO95872.1 cyclase [Flavobacterium enshiense DK69]
MRTTVFYIVILSLLISCDTKPKSSKEADASNPTETSKRKLIDLSHVFSDETIYWVTAEEFKLDTVYNGETPKGYYYSANNYKAAEHGGTHVDAPVHFSKTGQSVDEIPLEKLMGEAIKIDISSKALTNPDYLVGVEDFLNWEKKEKTIIPEGSIVLLQTGFSKYYPDKIKYLGTKERGEKAVKQLHFPGLSPAAAKWLVENRNINAIGIDTPSIDYGQSEYFESHVTLLSKNIPVFENLANLDKLPNKGFEIIALPMKIKGGSGAPLRIIAIIDDQP